MNRRIHFRRSGDNRQRIAAAGVNAFAFNGDGSLRDLQRLQISRRIKHGFASGQGCLGSVNKAAAVTGDAIGVGNHHVRRLACDFGIPVQLRAVATGHFVNDALRFPPGLQIRVVLDQATELGLIKLPGRIVEDYPLLTDVIILKLVM